METIKDFLDKEFNWYGEGKVIIHLTVYNALNWEKYKKGKKANPNFRLTVSKLNDVPSAILNMKVHQFEGDYSVAEQHEPTEVNVIKVLIPKTK